MALPASGPGSTYSSEVVDLDDYTIREPVEELFYAEYGRRCVFGDGNVEGLSSTDGNSIIHVKEELATGKGQTVGFGLIRQLGGFGVKNANELENREKVIDTADCRIRLGQHRDGVKSEDRLTRQGLTWNFLETGLKLLANHCKMVDEVWILRQAANHDPTDTLSTYYDNGGVVIDTTDDITSGLNDTLPIDAEHLVHCSADHTDQSLYDADDFLDRKYLLEALSRNEQLNNPMRTINFAGKDRFLMAVNSNVARRIRESDTEWYALIKANLSGPLAEHAWKAFTSRLLGEYEDVMMISSSFVPPGITGNTNGASVEHVYLNPLMGAQALACAYGMKTPSQSRLGLVYGDRDHKDKEYVSYFRLKGLQLTQFEGRDGINRNHSSMVLSSYATRSVTTAA